MKARVAVVIIAVLVAFACGVYLGEEKRRVDEAFKACIKQPRYQDCTKRYYEDRGWRF